MSHADTAKLIEEMLEVHDRTIVNLAVPAHYPNRPEIALMTVDMGSTAFGRSAFAPSLYFEKDPVRSFRPSTPIPEIAAKLALKKTKIAIAVTDKKLVKEAVKVYPWHGDTDYYANSERAAVLIGAFLSAMGELDGYDAVIGLSGDNWDDERADELEKHGLHVVYDDTKKLKRNKKKLVSPNDTRLTLYHRDSWSVAVVRMLSESSNSEALRKHCEEIVGAKAFYKALRSMRFKLSAKQPPGEVMARLVDEMTLGTAHFDFNGRPGYLESLEAWSPYGALDFISSNSTLFSKPRKWSGKEWYTQAYPVFCAMLPLWEDVFVARTRSGNPKKSDVNKQLSKVLTGKVSLDSEEAEHAFLMMREAARDTAAPKVAEALRRGVPISDVIA